MVVRRSMASFGLHASKYKCEAHRKTGIFQKIYTHFDVTIKESHYYTITRSYMKISCSPNTQDGSEIVLKSPQRRLSAQTMIHYVER